MKSFDLTAYLNEGIEQIAMDALRASIKNPRESAFILRFTKHAKLSQKNRMEYEEEGIHIPPFLIASITSSCNLFCSGCYARANGVCSESNTKEQLSDERWEDLFQQSSDLGIAFILLAGGEPLMRRNVIESAAAYENIIFPVFTNGTLIDNKYLKLFDKSRNLIPVISIEGGREQTDLRRGTGTYDLVFNVMEQLSKKGIFFGVSITLTNDNLEQVTDTAFIDMLRRNGCKLIFYVEYVPVTEFSKSLAPTEREREFLELRLAQMREDYDDILFLSFPGDEKFTGGCLAAGRGFFHISPDGNAEPCPFSPFSDINVKNLTLLEAISSPFFHKLNDSGLMMGEHDGGCLLFEHESEVKAMLSE